MMAYATTQCAWPINCSKEKALSFVGDVQSEVKLLPQEIPFDENTALSLVTETMQSGVAKRFSKRR